MRRLISILSLAALWQVGISWAQLAPYNEMNVTWAISICIRKTGSKRPWLAVTGAGTWK